MNTQNQSEVKESARSIEEEIKKLFCATPVTEMAKVAQKLFVTSDDTSVLEANKLISWTSVLEEEQVKIKKGLAKESKTRKAKNKQAYSTPLELVKEVLADWNGKWANQWNWMEWGEVESVIEPQDDLKSDLTKLWGKYILQNKKTHTLYSPLFLNPSRAWFKKIQAKDAGTILKGQDNKFVPPEKISDITDYIHLLENMAKIHRSETSDNTDRKKTLKKHAMKVLKGMVQAGTFATEQEKKDLLSKLEKRKKAKIDEQKGEELAAFTLGKTMLSKLALKEEAKSKTNTKILNASVTMNKRFFATLKEVKDDYQVPQDWRYGNDQDKLGALSRYNTDEFAFLTNKGGDEINQSISQVYVAIQQANGTPKKVPLDPRIEIEKEGKKTPKSKK